MVLETDGTVTFFDDQMEAIFGYQVPTAIGSGCELAIGAMLMGADPKAAVEIAMSRDTRTGGEITVETVGAKLEAVA